VALSAVREEKMLSELSSEFGIHANQIVHWKKELLNKAEEIFGHDTDKSSKDIENREAELCRQIGQLKEELDWLKKNLHLSSDDKKKLLDSEHKTISLRRQCELLGLNRRNVYYRSREEDPVKHKLLRLIDEIYTRSPYYGARRIAAELNRTDLGFAIDRKRVRRLMEEMGIEAL